MFELGNVRCTRGEKVDFLSAALRQFPGRACALQQGSILGIMSQNLIIGDLRTARVVVTANYDTPRMPLLPLKAFPGSTAKNLLFSLPFLLLPLLIAIAVSRLTGGEAYTGGALFLLLLLIGSGIAPVRTSLDTSDSGLLALFEVAASLPPELNVAYVLIDNRHFFGAGAALLRREYKLENAVLISIEGVGKGTELKACAKELSLAKNFAAASASVTINPVKSALRIPPTDEAAFKNGILITRTNEGGGRTYGRNETEISTELVHEAAAAIINFILH